VTSGRDTGMGGVYRERAVEYIGTGGTGGNIGRACRDGSRDEWTGHERAGGVQREGRG